MGLRVSSRDGEIWALYVEMDRELGSYHGTAEGAEPIAVHLSTAKLAARPTTLGLFPLRHSPEVYDHIETHPAHTSIPTLGFPYIPLNSKLRPPISILQ